MKKINIQRLVITLCFLAVCIGTQQIQTVKWDSGIIEACRSMLGIYMPIILITNYKWADFAKYKIPYVIWSLTGIIASIFFVPYAIRVRLDFLAVDTVIWAFGIFLMGCCIIHTVIDFFLEKYRPQLYLPLLIVWLVMMILMIFSKSSYWWPECYLALFLCLYMTKMLPEQRANLVWGMVDGIILGFLSIQAHSLLFRPFDRLGYFGNFCNPNHNSMFLCLCLAAILAKLLYVTGEQRKWMVRAFYFLLAGVCYSFIIMTKCSSGYLAVIVLTIAFLAAYCRILEKSVFIKMGLRLALLVVVMFPATYLAVRYIPTIHPHVLFYYQEGYSEDRVHSWDERNSAKYISFDTLLQSIFGEIWAIPNLYLNLAGMSGRVNDVQMTVNAGTLPEETLLCLSNDKASMSAADTVTGIDRKKPAALSPDEARNPILVRYAILKWYFGHLSLRGMPYEDQGFQLTEDHWIQDTHNIYLDYGINFGWPVMLLFILFICWGIGRLAKQSLLQGELEKFACLFILLVPPVFGLFEFSWGTGLLSTAAFYMAFREIFVT